MDVNKIILVGRLGQNPEMRFTPNGIPVTNFQLACGHTWKTPEGEQKKATEWFTVTTWRGTAETLNQLLAKGQQVYVEGRLETRSYEKDGVTRTQLVVQASNVVLLGSKAAAKVETPAETPEPEEDDLPF